MDSRVTPSIRPPAGAVRWPFASAWGLPKLPNVLDYPCLHRWGTHDGPTSSCFGCGMPHFAYWQAYRRWRALSPDSPLKGPLK